MASEGLQKLEEHLTCPLCLDLFTEPRILACHHVFCTKCVSLIVKTKEGENGRERGVVECPKCRKETVVPEGGATALGPAFSINTLRDAFDKLTTDSSVILNQHSIQTSLQEQEEETCRRHRSQSLDLYCRDCRVLVCRDCLLAERSHNEHSYSYVSELGAEGRRSLEGKHSELKALGKELETAVEEVGKRVESIDQEEKSIREKTTHTFARLAEVLRAEERRLLSELKGKMQNKRTVLSSQRQTLEAAQQKLQEEMKILETTVASSSNQKLLQNLPEIEEKIGDLTQKVHKLSYHPLEEVEVAGISLMSESALQDALQTSTIFLYQLDISRTTVTGEAVRFARTSKQAEFQVELWDMYRHPCHASQNVTAELKFLRNGLITTASVITRDPSHYTVLYRVDTCGRYELSVKVNEQHAPSSPFRLYIQKQPHQIWVSFSEITTLQRPTGLEVVGDKLYVSEYGGDKVTIFNSKLEKMHSIIGLPGPSEITADADSNVYVSTTNDHRVWKFSSGDEQLRVVGGEGSGKYHFNFPNGNCVHDGKLYVCDSQNYRVKVMDRDLNLLEVHGKKGKSGGNFNFPCDIDFDNDGMMYIVDGHNHRIQVFNSQWDLQRTIGKKGKGPGEMLQPVCIKIRGEYVFVTEYENNRVSVFSTSGQFQATFGERYLQEPEGLAIDEDGFVYVSHSRQKVLVFC